MSDWVKYCNFAIKDYANMINTVKTSFFLLVALVLSACTDSRKLATIHQAEMLMQEQPDSALRVLQTIDRRSLHGESMKE